MRKILIGAALVGILAAAHPALSQGLGSGDLELNPFFGGSWHSQNRFEITFPQSSPQQYKEFKLEQAFRGGVRLNVFNSGHWGEEFMYSYESNQTRFISIFPPGPEVNLGIQVHQFAVNTLYYFDADPQVDSAAVPDVRNRWNPLSSNRRSEGHRTRSAEREHTHI